MDGTGNLNIAGLMPLLSRLSEDPAALSAITGLMGGLSGQQKSAPPPQRQTEADPLSALAGLLGGKSSEPRREDDRGGGLSVGGIFGTREEIKNRIILLSAVRPYLSEERRQRLETVIRLLRLAELGSLSSLLGQQNGG